MRTRRNWLMALCALALTAWGADPMGDWYGTLEAGDQKLRIAFHLTKDADGKLSATLDSLDQNAMGMAASDVKVTGSKVVAMWADLNGVLDATLNDAGTELNGSWEQHGNKLSLKLTRKKLE